MLITWDYQYRYSRPTVTRSGMKVTRCTLSTNPNADVVIRQKCSIIYFYIMFVLVRQFMTHKKSIYKTQYWFRPPTILVSPTYNIGFTQLQYWFNPPTILVSPTYNIGFTHLQYWFHPPTIFVSPTYNIGFTQPTILVSPTYNIGFTHLQY